MEPGEAAEILAAVAEAEEAAVAACEAWFDHEQDERIAELLAVLDEEDRRC